MNAEKSSRRNQAAMTLIEVIGVLAVLAILSAGLLPALIRQLDKAVADQENAALKSFGDALQRSILRNRYIPGPDDWASAIATELGVNVSTVSTNARSRQRWFIIDPNLQIGANGAGLPYSQANRISRGSSLTNLTGQVVAPASPRVMILSSLGPAFPVSMLNGVLPNVADFGLLWNTADGTLPAGVSALSGWRGTGEELKIQRLNLSPLFVDLVLGSYGSGNSGYFAIDGSVIGIAPTNTFEGYFLQNSVLALYTGSSSNTLDSQQILVRDCSFVFESGIWKSSIVGGLMPGGMDVGGVVSQFLAAPGNTNAANSVSNAQQIAVAQSMLSYMSNYGVWAAGNFTDNNLRNYLKNTVQPNMMAAVQGLFSGSYYPVPQPCP